MDEIMGNAMDYIPEDALGSIDEVTNETLPENDNVKPQTHGIEEAVKEGIAQ